MEDNDSLLSQEAMKGLCACICIVSCISGIVLIILGFSSLEATEYGLDYSWLSKTISPQIFGNGLYFIGIGHSFIKFPKNVQTVEFSKERNANRQAVESRTSDGLEVTLEISFQYVLQPENLYKLYNQFGETFKQVIQNVAIDVLTEEATGYTAYNFFMDRGKIKDDFQMHLDKRLNSTCYSNVVFLQLRSVYLPNLFEQAIQESEVKKQDIQKANAELNKVKVETDTLKKSAVISKNVTINLAEGEAESLLKHNEAEILSLTKIQNSQTEAYSKFKSTLDLDNANLLGYIKAKLIKEYKGNDLALNLNSPEISSKS